MDWHHLLLSCWSAGMLTLSMTATASHLSAERVKGYSSPVKTGTRCTGKSVQGIWSLIFWNLLVMGLCRAHNTNSYLCFLRKKISVCHMEWPRVRLAVSTLSPLFQRGLQPKHVQLKHFPAGICWAEKHQDQIWGNQEGRRSFDDNFLKCKTSLWSP